MTRRRAAQKQAEHDACFIRVYVLCGLALSYSNNIPAMFFTYSYMPDIEIEIPLPWDIGTTLDPH
jgi:hypothetical protein